MQKLSRHLPSLLDWSSADLEAVFTLSTRLKRQLKRGQPHPLLHGKTLGMVFQKRSTRTRISFEVGMYQLGGQALFLSSDDLQLGRGETISDTARVLSRYLDGIMARVYAHQDIEALVAHASIPVINGLSDRFHPCQALTDFFTIQEQGRNLREIKVAYLGDGNNVAHSLLLAGALLGSSVSVACPQGYQPEAEVVAQAREIAAKTGATIQISIDPAEAAFQADVLYTDVWTSMGQEAEQEQRLKDLGSYQINASLAALANKDFLFMHCLPAHRDQEVSSEIIDGDHSIVFDQAENRLHVQKALLSLLLSPESAHNEL